MMTCEGHNGYFQIQGLLPKLVQRLETTYKTHDQDNTEILNCEKKIFKSFERKLLSCVRENF